MSAIQNLSVLTSFQSSELIVTPDETHEFLMSTFEVAKGYNVSPATIRRHLQLHSDELIRNRHFLGVQILNARGNVNLP